ncbi:MAG: HAMP domain-containing sensor histidine kinase [Alphaproteobacteria bacterium]
MAEPPEAASPGKRSCRYLIGGRWSSLRTHLIVVLTLVITLVYATVVFIEITDELHHANTELHHRTHVLTVVQAEALSVPLDSGDRREVLRQLHVLIVNPDIVEAEVLKPDGEIFATALSPDGEGTPANSVFHHHHHDDHEGLANNAPTTWKLIFGRVDDDLHALESEIKTRNGQIIGLLRVIITHKQLRLVQESMLWSHLKQFLIITVVIAATIGLFVTGLVQPLIRMTEAMDEVAAGNLRVPIPATDRRDEIGKMARALEVFKANAEQLKDALNKEREVNGLQRQFVSMVSHEFRTPLAIIDGHAQRMNRRLERLSPDQLREGLIKMRHSVLRLTELMESVLNAARLEEGRIAFAPQACSLIDMLAELCGSYADINMDRHFMLNVAELPESIVADPKLLRQVFSNLLSNACKYSSPGSQVWIEGRRDGENGVAISIRDEGVGIPPDELQKLFERFFRASTSTGIAGTGIGLHLVRHFVDLHGGHVEVSSTVGKGTAFTVHVPCSTPNQVSIPDAA